LRKAVEVYQHAAASLEAVEDPETLQARAKVLKMGGDALVELAEVYNREESLSKALVYYDHALRLTETEEDPVRRGVTLADTRRVLLALYDIDHSPANLRRAVRLLKDSLELLKADQNLERRGLIMALMGKALVRYAEVKDRHENLGRSIKLFEAAMGILKSPEYSDEREQIKEELRMAVMKLER
jgi:tetratricopeptide (TPR) repeat protein